ncbi:MAG: M20/M25/M40 family metallo-hydrolase, partial [Kiritimatiellae bacterium]|nr:M20/M25/M40 family metallo-hydrolase [Kiritimatiellia bacterium]
MTAIEDGIIEEYAKLVAFESVGADPMHLRDTVQCAIWLKDWLAKLGFAGELLATEKAKGAPPVLFAERKGAEGAPTILFYGHYDVQPVDPIEEWRTQPFKLTQGGDGRFYARGANDDKGQFFAFLCGMRDFLAETRCAPTIKILLEGQEESGSAALTAMARDIRRKIAADVLLVCDTNAAQGLRPAIVAGLRGVAHFEMTLEGPVCDLHSGEYGGAAPNPAQEIARMAASLHDDAGRVAVEGFYDGIVPPSDEEVRLATESTPDAATFEHETGV